MKPPPQTLEFASYMLTYKEDLKNLSDSIKDMENQADDNLQQALMKSSSLVKLNKKIKEIGFMSRTLTDLIGNASPLDTERLLNSLRRKIFESQCLLIEDIQKSMLKAVEAMSAAGSGLSLLADFEKMLKAFDKIDNKVEIE